jgi:hypothetical protein
MRFSFSLTFIFFISLNAFSQGWLDCGVKGGFGGAALVNSNVWKSSTVEHLLSPAYTFGGKVGVNFNMNFQITFDIMHKKSSQRYLFQPELESAVNGALRTKWNKTVTLNSFDLPLLFRHNGDNGSFFEIGPQFSIIGKIKETTDQPSASQTRDIKDNFTKTNLGAIVGFGSFMLGTQNTYLVLGFRVHYGLQDLISKKGGKDLNSYYPINNGELESFEPGFQFDEYKVTNPLSAVVYLEVNYDLAYLTRSNCKRTALKFF